MSEAKIWEERWLVRRDLRMKVVQVLRCVGDVDRIDVRALCAPSEGIAIEPEGVVRVTFGDYTMGYITIETDDPRISQASTNSPDSPADDRM